MALTRSAFLVASTESCATRGNDETARHDLQYRTQGWLAPTALLARLAAHAPICRGGLWVVHRSASVGLAR
jgi:hypothetical protein